MIKYIVLIFVLALGVALWVLFPKEQPETPNVPLVQDNMYTSEKFGISFSYPNAYVLTEREVGNGERGHYAIVLTRVNDMPVPENGEGPPTITLDIFQNNLDKLTLDAWLTGTNFSNFKLGNGQKASTTVDGTTGVRYDWSGLYEANSVVFLHRDNVVMVSGTYLNPADAIVSDFEDVLASIKLR